MQRLSNDSYCQDLSADHGLAEIKELETSNVIGKKLSQHLAVVFNVMRMSLVLGNSKLSTGEFARRYSRMDYINYAQRGIEDNRVYKFLRGKHARNFGSFNYQPESRR